MEHDAEFSDLVDETIERIEQDLFGGDVEALAELLTYLPKDVLKYYLGKD